MALPLDPNLESLPVYQPGRPVEEVARELGLAASELIKLASNENPCGPSPRALDAMREELGRLNSYPDGNSFYLKDRLASHLGVDPENLVFGNGSNEIIEFVGHALLRPGTNAVVSEYCFAIYPIVARLFGAEVITVPARHFGHDLRAMARAITPATRAVFVANPNNPTGTLAPSEAVMELVENVPPEVLLVMDEAYLEYLEDPLDLLPLIRERRHPNLLLMRTFSKIYGLAGLRVGYGIGAPELIAALQKIRQPFNLNRMAQVAARAALDDREHLAHSRRVNGEGLRFFESALPSLGLEYVPSAANFLLVRVEDGPAVFTALQHRGIIVRPMTGYGLPEWIRISIGTEAQNHRCLDALRQILKPIDNANSN